MKLTDLHGYEIEITNVKQAIKIAKRNTGNSHEDKSYTDFDKRQNAYWTDMHEKSTAIKEQVKNH